MKALVYNEPKKFTVCEVDIPECVRNQILIKVKSRGICKTDVHIHNGSFISKFPIMPGHEFSAQLKKLGQM